MEIKLSLALPREELSVPVVRRVLKASLQALGVEQDVVHDIQVALTEAVTNVLDHAAHTEEYVVSAGIDGDTCVIEIVDRGGGFDGSRIGHGEVDTAAEGGRGIQLMRALVDRVTFREVPKVGTVVHLEKRLEWTQAAVVKRLSEGNPPTVHGPWSEPPTLG